MRVRDAYEGHLKHAGQRDIVDETGSPGEKRRVFQSMQRPANGVCHRTAPPKPSALVGDRLRPLVGPVLWTGIDPFEQSLAPRAPRRIYADTPLLPLPPTAPA